MANKIKRGFNISKKWVNLKFNPDSCKPKSCSILLTNRCPLRCQMCKIWRSKKKDPSTKKVISWVNDLYSFGIRDFMLTGGEPLMRKDLFEIAEFIKNMGCRLNIITNGILVNKKNVKKISKYFDSVGVSLDGVCPKTNDKIRGVKGAFKKTTNAIKLLKDAGVKNLRINFTIQKDNQHEIIQAMKLAEELGVRILFQFVEVSGFGNLSDSKLQTVNLDNLKSQFNEIKNKKHVTKSPDYFKLVLDTLQNKRKPLRCFAPYVSILIDSDGSIYPCPDIDIKMGNLNKEKINDIYFSENFTKLRNSIRKKQIEKCKICMQACEMEGSFDFCLSHLIKSHLIKEHVFE